MAHMEGKFNEVEKLVSSIERKIYSAESTLKSSQEIRKVLEDLLNEAKNLKKLSYESEYRDLIKKQISAKKLDVPLSRAIAELSSLKAFFSDFEARDETLQELFSKLKSSSEFRFSDFNEASDFADSCFSLFPEDSFHIAPLFIGLLNLADFAKAKSLAKEGNSFIAVEKSPKEIMDALASFGIASNFSIYNSFIKADFIKSSAIKITAEPSKLQRIEIAYNSRK